MKNSFFVVGRALCCAAVLLAVPWLRAEGTNAYSGAKWVFLDVGKVLEQAAGITHANYPDCDEATVDQRLVRSYRADGTGEAQDETFVKVLTEKGKRNNRGLSLYFQLPYNTVEVVKLEVLNPSGQARVVDVAANSKEMINSGQMSMNIYDTNSRIFQVNIPKVEIGDIVHSITRTTTERSIIPGEFAENNVFEGPGYLRHSSYEVYSPADKPLKRIELRDEVPGTVHYSTKPGENRGILHRWEVSYVPRMFDEPSMPPYETVLQRLLVSTTPNWQAVSKWYWEVSKPHLEATTPGLQKTVADLSGAVPGQMEKIKALFYYVSNKIRYMGITPEKDRPGFEPHDVGLTFENKYGVCRDKAALLVSMLRLAGLNAYPVLVSVGSKKDPDVPEPFFNHAIVGVEIKKGDYVLMDPTDENTKDLLPSYECNQSYLLCRPEGDTIRTSPIIPADQNMMRIKTTALLNADGRLQASSDLWFDGINDNDYREIFSRMKPDDIQRFFESNLKRAVPGAKLKSLRVEPENMLDVTQAVHAKLEFTVNDEMVCGDGKAVVSLPWLGTHFGIANFILEGTGLDKRKYPLRTFIACGVNEEMSLQLGDGFGGAVSLPSYSPLSDDRMSYQRRIQFVEHRLDCSRELKLKAVEFSPTQYASLKRALKTIEYDERKTPVMAILTQPSPSSMADNDAPPQTTVDSDARILESHKELEVKDAHTAVLKVRYSKRVLTYNGKKREAEVKIPYNPACEDAKLISATVISKTGQKQEITPKEINVMDEGWNASAKRYTGGKVLVANLPGVDIGSTFEVQYEISSKDKPFLAGFEAFQFFDDLEKKSFQLTAPCDVKVQKRLTGAASGVGEHTNIDQGNHIFQWRAEQVKALPAEPQLPPDWVYEAGVQYFVGDEKTYLDELQQTMLDRSANGAKAAEVAKDLASHASSRLDALAAIRDFVAKSIRLAGPSFTDLPLRELSAADTTLTDGYGHAADRAILLHAMLKAAGFDPQFVLASGLPPIAAITNVITSFPMPQTFQAPLVRVTVEGQPYYLNDTDQYSRLGSTLHEGRLCLVLPNQQQEVIRAAKGGEDGVETVYTLSLTDSGKTRVGISHLDYGVAYDEKNRFFSELPPEERRRYYQELVSDVAQGARPVGDLTTRFDTYPGREEFTVEIDNYSVVDGKYCYFDLPFTPSLFATGAEHRKLPLFISQHHHNTFRTEINLPAGFPHIAIEPKSQRLEAPDGGGQAVITETDIKGQCVITHDLQTSPTIVSPQDYAALLRVESTLGKRAGKVFLLEK